MHGDVPPRMWKIIYRWCGKLKGWTEKCVARFVRWEICHWTLLWKRISLWYYCSILDKNHVISMNSRTLKRGLREYGLRRRNEFHSEHEVWEMIKHQIEGPSSRCGTSYSVAVPRDMVMVYKSLIYRHLSFERPGSFCVDHSSREVQTQLGMLTDTTNLNLTAYLYMAVWMNYPGEYCGSKYVKVTIIP